jgi:hypothetical protein
MEFGEILIFISLGIGFLVIILLLIDIYVSRKRRNERGEISLKFSEEFWKRLEGIIEEETKRMVIEIEKKILEDLINEQKRQISNFRQKLEVMAEEEKKGGFSFFSKIGREKKKF